MDMSLIRGIDRSPMKQKLLRSIITLCRELDIQIIARTAMGGDSRRNAY